MIPQRLFAEFTKLYFTTNNSIPSPTIYKGSKEQSRLPIGNMTLEPKILTILLDLSFGPCRKPEYVDSIILLNQSLFFLSVLATLQQQILYWIQYDSAWWGAPAMPARQRPPVVRDEPTGLSSSTGALVHCPAITYAASRSSDLPGGELWQTEEKHLSILE